MDYDASKNTVERTPVRPKAESDQVGTMLMGRDGSMPGMSGGHAGTVESAKVGKWKIALVLGMTAAMGLVGTIIFVMVNGMRVDYSGSYQIAKELKGKVQEMRSGENCKKVVANADVDYLKMETYAGYVDKCRDVTGEIEDLNEKLGKTEGVRRNGGIMDDYNKFLSSFATVKEGNAGLEEALKFYQTWHEWILAQEKVDGWEASDTDIMTVAKILIDSGNEKFKKYAEGWATKKKKANTAYRAFHYSDILAKNRSELLKAMNTAQKEFADWEAKNTIAVSEVVNLVRGDTARVYTDFEALSSLIRENYENNYNHGSGDCLETFTDVICD